MGWSAYATKDGEALAIRYDAHYRGTLCDETLAAAFNAASKRAGASDGKLSYGSLGLRGCAKALGEATGMNPYSEDGWDCEDVKRAAMRADWRECDPAYRESARAFLETCADNGLGVIFSF